MLKRLEIRNFKAWKHLDMPLARVTGLFGPNNAGKSSIIQFLLLLQQTKNAADRSLVLDFGGPDRILDLGSYQDVVHGRDASTDMSWMVDWMLSENVRIDDLANPADKAGLEGNRLQTRCAVRAFNGERAKNDLQTMFMSYAFGGNEFSVKPDGRSTKRYRLATANGHLLSFFEAEYEKLLDRIFYLGPLRVPPSRVYRWSDRTPGHVGFFGEHAIDALVAAVRHPETQPVDFQEDPRSLTEIVDYWLDTLGLARDFAAEEITPDSMLYRVRMRTDVGSPRVDMIDAGFGVTQLLPIIVLLHYVPEESIILLEQPELHLHPVAQTGLADMVLSAVNHRKIQVVVESHSEVFMRRLQRRIAEGSMQADDVQLYHAATEGGVAKLADLKINQWGEIHHWPKDFFGDEMEEIASTTKASLTRKMEHKNAQA